MRPTSWEKAGSTQQPLLSAGPTEVITISDSEEEEDRDAAVVHSNNRPASPDVKPATSSTTATTISVAAATTSTTASVCDIVSSGGGAVVVELSGSGPTSGCPSVMTLTPVGAGTAPPLLQDSGEEGDSRGGYLPASNLSTPSRENLVGPPSGNGAGSLLVPAGDTGHNPVKSEPGTLASTSTPGTVPLPLHLGPLNVWGDRS
jgi:hypothetical protein